MEQFIIYLEPDKVSVFEHLNGDISTFYIRGEEYISTSPNSYQEDLQTLYQYMLQQTLYDNFQEMNVLFIYESIPPHLAYSYMQTFLPCQSWQVISLETAVEIAVAKLSIVPKNFLLAIDNTSFWKVETEKMISLQRASAGTVDMSFTKLELMQAYYSPFKKSQHEHLEQYKNKITSLENQIQELMQIAKYGEEALKQTQQLLQQREVTIQRLRSEEQERMQVERLVGKRKIIRVPDSNHDDNVPAFLKFNLSNVFQLIEWHKQQGDIITKGEVIAGIGSKGIIAISSGRLFTIIPDESPVVPKTVIAVIADPADTYEAVKVWLKEMDIR